MTTLSKEQERTLALAGIIQAATLVYEITMENKLDEVAFSVSMHSVYNQNPQQVLDVYGSIAGVQKGLLTLSNIFTAPKSLEYREVSRYTISALHLARKLLKNKNLGDQLANKIRFASSQAEYFSATHSNVIASIAQAYVDTLGTLPFRIQVIGRPEIMKRAETLEKARALLMAAVRSAVLWQQLGASHWHLLFKRKALAQSAKQLLAESNAA
jgi:high frequency lysogenization protein